MLILTKADATESNTGYAQGGIAAAIGADDSPALHAADTMRAGDGLCDEAAVRVLVEEGPRYVRELIDWGARFDRDAERTSGARARSGAQRAPRSCTPAMRPAARSAARCGSGRARSVGRRPSITRSSPSLIVEDGIVPRRPLLRQPGRAARRCARDATLLATGGAGQVFRETTNPAVATGDGIALAYRRRRARLPISSSCSSIRPR